MGQRQNIQAWQTGLQARLGQYRSARGVVAAVRWLHRQGLSLPLAVLLVLRFS
jgi:hypothetical protein